MVLAIVKVVVAVIIVAVPIVVDAVHDNHPLLLDPFPRTERTGMPQRNGRPRPVARMVRDVVTGETVRRRMVAWLLTEVSMPCGGWLLDMRGRSGMLHRVWFGCRSRDVGSPRLLGRSCRVSVRSQQVATLPLIKVSKIPRRVTRDFAKPATKDSVLGKRLSVR